MHTHHICRGLLMHAHVALQMVRSVVRRSAAINRALKWLLACVNQQMPLEMVLSNIALVTPYMGAGKRTLACICALVLFEPAWLAVRLGTPFKITLIRAVAPAVITQVRVRHARLVVVM